MTGPSFSKVEVLPANRTDVVRISLVAVAENKYVLRTHEQSCGETKSVACEAEVVKSLCVERG